MKLEVDHEPFSRFVEVLGKRINEDSVKAIIMRYLLQQSPYPSPNVTWYESQRAGVALLIQNSFVQTIFLYGEGKDGFLPFEGRLVGGLTFESAQKDVRCLLGEPTKAGKPVKQMELGAWDKYHFLTHEIHFSYSQQFDNRIELITLEPVK